MAGKRNLNILPTEKIVSLYQSGMTMKQISQICKCAPSGVFVRLKLAGIETRGREDYPVTEKQREARRKNGKASLGIKRSDETKKRISDAKKRYRKREDYEFGGHETKRKDGYIKVFVPDHPMATKDGFVLKHRLIVEREIGRYLEPNEDVHHVNGVRDDNRIENLQLLSHSEHTRLHQKNKGLKEKEDN